MTEQTTAPIPPATLERLRNWQRSRVAIDGMIQATVDALQEAQGQPPGAQIDLERGVWLAPQGAAEVDDGNE